MEPIALVDYLTTQEKIFCVCPACESSFRLNEARLTWGKEAEKDLLDKLREQKTEFTLSLSEQEIQFSKTLAEHRADAAKRSRAISLGKMLEHISPYFPAFKHNPRDARFIGDPIDYVLFKGAHETRSVEEIIIAEIKSGKSRLTKTERSVKKAVEAGKVSFEEIRVA